MKIVVDDKIPYIRPALERMADEVVYLPGARIGADDVRDADALVVRTRTRCDEALLAGSKVRLVATATIGYDHIDTAYLERAGVAWMNCPGCNAGSVAQYVECSLLLLQQQKGLHLQQATIGIVGCGHVGSRVRAVAERLGMHVLVCDPLLGAPDFVSLDDLARQSDVITFHVPLTREGAYATFHMGDERFFSRLSRVPYIINTSRGEVVDNRALFRTLCDGRVRDAVLDVWEGEPSLDVELLERVFIGTPHIAGYSADGKVNADNMVVESLCSHFGLPRPEPILPPALPDGFRYTGNPLELYNPLHDSEALKNAPESFEQLRNNYPVRREIAG